MLRTTYSLSFDYLTCRRSAVVYVLQVDRVNIRHYRSGVNESHSCASDHWALERRVRCSSRYLWQSHVEAVQRCILHGGGAAGGRRAPPVIRAAADATARPALRSVLWCKPCATTVSSPVRRRTL